MRRLAVFLCLCLSPQAAVVTSKEALQAVSGREAASRLLDESTVNESTEVPRNETETETEDEDEDVDEDEDDEDEDEDEGADEDEDEDRRDEDEDEDEDHRDESRDEGEALKRVTSKATMILESPPLDMNRQAQVTAAFEWAVYDVAKKFFTSADDVEVVEILKYTSERRRLADLELYGFVFLSHFSVVTAKPDRLHEKFLDRLRSETPVFQRELGKFDFFAGVRFDSVDGHVEAAVTLGGEGGKKKDNDDFSVLLLAAIVVIGLGVFLFFTSMLISRLYHPDDRPDKYGEYGLQLSGRSRRTMDTQDSETTLSMNMNEI